MLDHKNDNPNKPYKMPLLETVGVLLEPQRRSFNGII